MTAGVDAQFDGSPSARRRTIQFGGIRAVSKQPLSDTGHSSAVTARQRLVSSDDDGLPSLSDLTAAFQAQAMPAIFREVRKQIGIAKDVPEKFSTLEDDCHSGTHKITEDSKSVAIATAAQDKPAPFRPRRSEQSRGSDSSASSSSSSKSSISFALDGSSKDWKPFSPKTAASVGLEMRGRTDDRDKGLAKQGGMSESFKELKSSLRMTPIAQKGENVDQAIQRVSSLSRPARPTSAELQSHIRAEQRKDSLGTP